MSATPSRILVIGSPGAGKSTLARALAAATGLPLVHLDRAYWRSGWVEPTKAAWAAAVATLVAAPRWIIDGNYGGSLPQRLAAADAVVLLDLPTWRCVSRILRRAWTLRGTARPDMADGCPERFDLAFLWYVVRFRAVVAPRVAVALAGFDGPVHRLRTPAEVAAFQASPFNS